MTVMVVVFFHFLLLRDEEERETDVWYAECVTTEVQCCDGWQMLCWMEGKRETPSSKSA